MSAALKIVASTTYQIEKGVPLPKNTGRGWCRYPFRDMQVGDSFTFPASIHTKVRAAAFQHGKRCGTKFTVHIDGDTGRCWRIA